MCSMDCGSGYDLLMVTVDCTCKFTEKLIFGLFRIRGVTLIWVIGLVQKGISSKKFQSHSTSSPALSKAMNSNSIVE